MFHSVVIATVGRPAMLDSTVRDVLPQTAPPAEAVVCCAEAALVTLLNDVALRPDALAEERAAFARLPGVVPPSAAVLADGITSAASRARAATLAARYPERMLDL